MKKTLVVGLPKMNNGEIIVEDPTEPIDTMKNDITEEGKVTWEDISSTVFASKITPVTLLYRSGTDKGNIATLVLLCKDEKNSNMFTLIHNYIVDDGDEEILENIPFYEENSFIGNKLTCDMLLNNIPCYITDLQYSYDEKAEYDSKFRLLAIDNKDSKVVSVAMNPGVFASLAFIDESICTPSLNSYDVATAAVSGYATTDKETEVFIVDSIGEEIKVSDTKVGNNIGTIFECVRPGSEEEIRKIKVLTAFDLDCKINHRRLQKECPTIEELQESFLNEDSEYLGSFMFNCRVTDNSGESTDYMIIKAQNDKNDLMIIMLDQKNQDELIEKLKVAVE